MLNFTFISLNFGDKVQADSKSNAKFKFVVIHCWYHQLDDQFVEFRDSRVFFVIQVVFIFAKVVVAQELQFQYFHVVLQSNETRYFIAVFVGSSVVNVTHFINHIFVVSI